VLQIHSQRLDSSNSDPSQTTFLLTTSYFLAHYSCVLWDICHDLIHLNLEKEKKNIMRRKKKHSKLERHVWLEIVLEIVQVGHGFVVGNG